MINKYIFYLKRRKLYLFFRSLCEFHAVIKCVTIYYIGHQLHLFI